MNQLPKRYADILLDGAFKRVTIWNILNLINSAPVKYERIKGQMYSTHKKVENKKLMSFVAKAPKYKSFFRYKSNKEHYQTGEGYEESATHEAYKDLVADLKELNLSIYGKKVTLFITQAEIEQKVKANGNDYIADVLFWFDKSEPEYYVAKWGGKLAFEINYTHPVGHIKKYDFDKEKIALFEHSVSKRLSLEDCTSEQREKEEIEFIKSNYLSKIVYGELLSDPEQEEYLEMKELEDAKNEIFSLKEQLNLKDKTIKSYIERDEANKNNINKKEKQLDELKDKLLANINELNTIKANWAYKVFIHDRK